MLHGPKKAENHCFRVKHNLYHSGPRIRWRALSTPHHHSTESSNLLDLFNTLQESHVVGAALLAEPHQVRKLLLLLHEHVFADPPQLMLLRMLRGEGVSLFLQLKNKTTEAFCSCRANQAFRLNASLKNRERFLLWFVARGEAWATCGVTNVVPATTAHVLSTQAWLLETG